MEGGQQLFVDGYINQIESGRELGFDVELDCESSRLSR